MEASKVGRVHQAENRKNRDTDHRWRVYCDCGFKSNGYTTYSTCEDKRLTHLRSHSGDSGALPDSPAACPPPESSHETV